MVRLEILSGKQAGFHTEARHFPFRVGRQADCQLQLDEDGVWAQHFEITSSRESGFKLVPQSGALVMINQQPVPEARLKSGDIITAGAVRLLFGLSATKQRGLRWREWLVWALVLGVTATQIALIIWLVSF